MLLAPVIGKEVATHIHHRRLICIVMYQPPSSNVAGDSRNEQMRFLEGQRWLCLHGKKTSFSMQQASNLGPQHDKVKNYVRSSFYVRTPSGRTQKSKELQEVPSAAFLQSMVLRTPFARFEVRIAQLRLKGDSHVPCLQLSTASGKVNLITSLCLILLVCPFLLLCSVCL
jgi:hypothetical protein